MNCPHCNAEVPDEYTFCNNCGAPLDRQNAAPQTDRTQEQPNVAPEQQMPPAAPAPAAQVPENDNGLSTQILVFGILGVSLCFLQEFGAIPALVFSILGMKKSGVYAEQYRIYNGKAKAGRILSIIGLVLSITICVCYVLGIIFAFALAGVYGNIVYQIINTFIPR